MKSTSSPWLVTGSTLLLFGIGALFWFLQTSGTEEGVLPSLEGPSLDKPVERRSTLPSTTAPSGPPLTQRGSMPAPFAAEASPVSTTENVLSIADMTVLSNALSAAREAKDHLFQSASTSSGMQAAGKNYSELVLRFGPVAYAEVLQDPSLAPVLHRMVQTPAEFEAFRRSMAVVAEVSKVDLPIWQARTMSDLVSLADQLSAAVRTIRGGNIGGDLPPHVAAQAAVMARASILAEAMHQYGTARQLTFDPAQQKFVPKPAQTNGLKR